MRERAFYSIFGQIESIAAEVMIKSGKAKRLPGTLPAEVATNQDGKPALLAITMPRRYVAEFERLIADLYS